jgi:hypothetical protein
VSRFQCPFDKGNGGCASPEEQEQQCECEQAIESSRQEAISEWRWAQAQLLTSAKCETSLYADSVPSSSRK